MIREYQINYFNTKGLKLEYVEYHNVDSILLDVSVGKGIAILDSFSRGIHDAGIACLPLDLEMPFIGILPLVPAVFGGLSVQVQTV